MERATFLTRVVLENYKSIAHGDVRLGPLNYLVGPNGAGKSNFLDALRFVADALTHSVEQALCARGGRRLDLLLRTPQAAGLLPHPSGLHYTRRSQRILHLESGSDEGCCRDVMGSAGGEDRLAARS